MIATLKDKLFYVRKYTVYVHLRHDPGVRQALGREHRVPDGGRAPDQGQGHADGSATQAARRAGFLTTTTFKGPLATRKSVLLQPTSLLLRCHLKPVLCSAAAKH